MSVSLSTGLLKLWKHSYYPVVLIVWECSKNIGYWCFPTEETDIEKPENDTVSVSVKYTHVFDDEGVQRIKSQVESYYLTKVYKIHNSKYKCNIYPIWMPQYRIFTSGERISCCKFCNNCGRWKIIKLTVVAFHVTYG